MRRSHHAALFCATALVFIGLFLVPPKSTVAFSALDTTQRGARGIERAGLFVRETTYAFVDNVFLGVASLSETGGRVLSALGATTYAFVDDVMSGLDLIGASLTGIGYASHDIIGGGISESASLLVGALPTIPDGVVGRVGVATSMSVSDTFRVLSVGFESTVASFQSVYQGTNQRGYEFGRLVGEGFLALGAYPEEIWNQSVALSKDNPVIDGIRFVQGLTKERGDVSLTFRLERLDAFSRVASETVRPSVLMANASSALGSWWGTIVVGVDDAITTIVDFFSDDAVVIFEKPVVVDRAPEQPSSVVAPIPQAVVTQETRDVYRYITTSGGGVSAYDLTLAIGGLRDELRPLINLAMLRPHEGDSPSSRRRSGSSVDLSGYLQLVGGDLTGALSGTDATFSGNLSVEGTLADSDGDVGSVGDVLQSTSVGTDWVATSTLGLSIDTSNFFSLSEWYATTTDALDEGLSNLYYSDARVASYIAGSSTIPHVSGVSGDVLQWNGSGWVSVSTSSLGISGITDHGLLTGLSDDDHTQYALLAGRSGGQTLVGGTGATDDLVLDGSAATAGSVTVSEDGDINVGGLLSVRHSNVSAPYYSLATFGSASTGYLSISQGDSVGRILNFFYGSDMGLSNGSSLLWSDSTDGALGTVDTGLSRISAGILGVTNGSSGGGALMADYLSATSTTATSTFAGRIYIPNPTVGQDLVDGLVLENITPSVGLELYSPAIRFTSNGFKSSVPGAGSKTASWWVRGEPINGLGGIGSKLAFLWSIDGSTATTSAWVEDSGDFVINGSFRFGVASPAEIASVDGDQVLMQTGLIVNGTSTIGGPLVDGSSSAGLNGYVLQSTSTGVQWVATSSLGISGITDHGLLTGLSDDDHTQYALLAGRSGGQTLVGGTGASDTLILDGSLGTSGALVVGASGALLAPDGNATTPAYSFANATGIGIYNGGGNELSFDGGSHLFTINSSNLLNLVSNKVNLGSAVGLNWGTIGGSMDVGLSRISAGILGVTNGSSGGGALMADYLSATSTTATSTFAGVLYAAGSFADSTGSKGVSGMVLQSTGTGVQWAATSTLGISGGLGTGGPSFSVNKNATNQTVTANVATLLTWSTEVFDTNNNFSTSTGKFTPTVAGKYIINGTVYCPGATNCYVYIYKNGSLYLQGGESSASSVVANISAVVDMNGSTDYVELYGLTGATTISGAVDSTQFSGALLAPIDADGGGWTTNGSYTYLTNAINLVGVGSTSPSARFIVKGSGTATNAFQVVSSADVNILTVSDLGFVGIGTTSPWRNFSTVGTVGFSSTLSAEAGSDNYLCIDPVTYEVTNGGANCGASSERFKENIVDLAYGLDEVKALRPVNFTYKREITPDGSTHIGLIAEEVAQIVPEVVEFDEDGKPESVSYDNLVALLIKAVQELSDKVDVLLASAGQSISGGVAHFVDAVVDRLTVGSAEEPSGITLFDDVTGEPYCLSVHNGATVTRAGACDTQPLDEPNGDGSGAVSASGSTTSDPVVDEPTTDEPGGDEPVVDATTLENPPAEEAPVVVEPPNETPAESVGDVAPEEPAVEVGA